MVSSAGRCVGVCVCVRVHLEKLQLSRAQDRTRVGLTFQPLKAKTSYVEESGEVGSGRRSKRQGS